MSKYIKKYMQKSCKFLHYFCTFYENLIKNNHQSIMLSSKKLSNAKIMQK